MRKYAEAIAYPRGLGLSVLGYDGDRATVLVEPINQIWPDTQCGRVRICDGCAGMGAHYPLDLILRGLSGSWVHDVPAVLSIYPARMLGDGE